MSIKKITGSFIKYLRTVAVFSGLLVAPTVCVSAQQALNSVEVLVNDEPITSFDINQRLRLVVAISGGIRSEEEFLKVREQVIRSMIDERLQLQEAAELEFSISDSEVEGFFVRRAQGVGQTPEQFEAALQQIGSSKETLSMQMKAEFAWSQIVQGRMGSFVSVSDEEVEAQIQRIRDNKGKFEYRLAEIVLQVSNPDQEASVAATAEQLVSQVRAGSSFPEIAQQLSASPTAAVGGDLGWITADEMAEEHAAIIENLDVGQVSDAIRTPGGYLILALRDRRRILTADPLDTRLSLRQVYLTSEQLLEDGRKEKYESYVNALDPSSTNCGQVQRYATEAGADENTEIGIIRLRDFNAELRAYVTDLPIGQPSEIVKLEDGWRTFFVCQREEAQIQEPDFDAIYSQIEQQRLSMMGRRYLRDLRRDAIIDYR
ncbi:chaperone SurA [Kordiimonas sediminis]|uniref:Parvulin-like PPIase n=1 Tax=Kordiimonas sediminis TaxID=1735581 RepID=A0A919AX12_9PROT|nr:peptidylprolyl isomerase [Kordiimonas sediminis]GHF27644.1 chaperone SurA [Kordiimonas sediminis]